MSWHLEPLVGFDLETTGTEPLEARIVTAAIVEVRGDGRGAAADLAGGPGDTDSGPGLRDPRHQHASGPRRRAAPPPTVADEIAEALAGYWRRGVPVVAYNAPST